MFFSKLFRKESRLTTTNSFSTCTGQGKGGYGSAACASQKPWRCTSSTYHLDLAYSLDEGAHGGPGLNLHVQNKTCWPCMHVGQPQQASQGLLQAAMRCLHREPQFAAHKAAAFLEDLHSLIRLQAPTCKMRNHRAAGVARGLLAAGLTRYSTTAPESWSLATWLCSRQQLRSSHQAPPLRTWAAQRCIDKAVLPTHSRFSGPARAQRISRCRPHIGISQLPWWVFSFTVLCMGTAR